VFKDLGTFDHDAELGAAARADHEGGRRRESERTGTCDDDDGDRGGERGCRRGSEGEPSGEREHRYGDHDRHEYGRDPICEALHWCLACLRLDDEAGDPGERGLRAHPRRLDD
jgi:hypothetical protein